jgi:hypothetical protein
LSRGLGSNKARAASESKSRTPSNNEVVFMWGV